MGCFRKIDWSSDTLWGTTLVILGFDLVSTVFHPFCRQHTSYSFSINNETNTDVSDVEALVPLTMIVTILILDSIAGIIGILGFVTERPIYLRVYVTICRINLARFAITVLVLSLAWIYHYDFSKYEMNLLMLVDSSLFLDQFNILEKFPQGRSQVFVTCIIMFQLFMCKWLTACVVYSYYLKMENKIKTSDVYSIAQPLTSPLINGIDASQRHGPPSYNQLESVLPTDLPPPYTDQWN